MTLPDLPASTHIAAVHLHVSDLQQSLAFYSDLLGFRPLRSSGNEVWLSATGDAPHQLHLTEFENARPRPSRATGLFHVAYRAPDRAGLGRWLHRLLSQDVPLQGASDHGVSEALYLADPDGLGVELYCDRPRERWQSRGKYVAMGSEQLDTADLLKQAPGPGSGQTSGQTWNGLDPATDVGHVHLCVSSLEVAERFYIDSLGMDAMQRDFPGALFIAAGGYHHHIGANTWRSAGSPPAPEDAVGLRSFTLGVPAASLADIRTGAESAGQSAKSGGADETDGEGFILRDEDEITVRVLGE